MNNALLGKICLGLLISLALAASYPFFVNQIARAVSHGKIFPEDKRFYLEDDETSLSAPVRRFARCFAVCMLTGVLTLWLSIATGSTYSLLAPSPNALLFPLSIFFYLKIPRQ